MVLGFKPQFISKVLDLSKTTTIREDKFRRWKVGMKIHFYSGPYIKNGREQFASGVVKSVTVIHIYYLQGYLNQEHGLCINICENIEWSICNANKIRRIIRDDGFDSTKEFIEFFPKDFRGVLIEWEDLKPLKKKVQLTLPFLAVEAKAIQQSLF